MDQARAQDFASRPKRPRDNMVSTVTGDNGVEE